MWSRLDHPEKMPYFDVVIAVPDNRKNAYILNILKGIGKNYKVGILIDYDQFSYHKRASTNRQFLSKLLEFGAKEVTERSQCAVFIVPILRYSEEFLHKVSRHGFIRYQKVFSYFRFWFDTHHYSVINNEFKFCVLFVEDVVLMQDIFAEDGIDFSIASNIRPVNFAYTAYPAFPGQFKVDYLIVFPTKLGFKSRRSDETDILAKYTFIRNINRLLKQIPSTDKIAYKHHSVVDGGTPFIEKKLEGGLSYLPIILIKLVKKLFEVACQLDPSKNRPTNLKGKIVKILIGCEYFLMRERCNNFSEFTENHNLSAELFYPNIGKGIISGRSNAVWGALKAKLAVYNCDDNVPGDGFGDFQPALKLTYERCGITPCHGELRFDQSKFNNVNQSGSLDLVDYLINEIPK